MLGTTGGRRVLGQQPGSQTHHQHHHNQQVEEKTLQQSQQYVHHPFPTFPFPPHPNLHHFAAAAAAAAAAALQQQTLTDPSIIPNQTTAISTSNSNLWPGSPTLSSTTGPLNTTGFLAANSSRFSALDFHANGEGEFSHKFSFFI